MDLKRFNKLELVIKRRLILYTINETLKTTNGIEKVNIDDIIKLCSNNIGNKYLIPNKKVKILVKFNIGEAEATAWGCDLTYDYVKLNADYRS